MDHVLDSMLEHYEPLIEAFNDEQQLGEYEDFRENPLYGEVMAKIEAMNVIRRYLGWEELDIKTELELRED